MSGSLSLKIMLSTPVPFQCVMLWKPRSLLRIVSTHMIKHVNLTLLILFILFSVLSYSEFLRGIIEGFLSSVTLWLFFAVLPLVSILIKNVILFVHFTCLRFFPLMSSKETEGSSCCTNWHSVPDSSPVVFIQEIQRRECGCRERERKNHKHNCIRFKGRIISHTQLARGMSFQLQFRPSPEYAGEMWKQNLTLKTHQTFTVHTTLGEFENGTITGHFGFVFEGNSVRKITWLSWRHCFRKAAFSKCFSSTRKLKADVFKFLRFEEQFWKAPFSWRSIVGW